MRALALLALLSACGGGSTASDLAMPGDLGTSGPLLAWFDLPREDSTQSLSGIVYDEAARTLWAIQDFQPRLVPLTAGADFSSWTVGTPLALTGRPSPTWDGEGLTRASDGSWLAVTIETQPLIEAFTVSGAYTGPIATPAKYAAQPPGNMGIESLSTSPSGNYLFFANEGALTTDGPIADKTNGTRLRILRRSLATSTDEEHAYLTDPCGDGQGGTLGVSDVTAVSDDRVLVLERGYQSGYGNTVRIYEADLSSGPDVSNVTMLDSSTTFVKKTLLLDLSTLPSDGIPAGETQPNPILDNYEGLALGPLLPDGRRTVFAITDDNKSTAQVARVLVLAL